MQFFVIVLRLLCSLFHDIVFILQFVFDRFSKTCNKDKGARNLNKCYNFVTSWRYSTGMLTDMTCNLWNPYVKYRSKTKLMLLTNRDIGPKVLVEWYFLPYTLSCKPVYPRRREWFHSGDCSLPTSGLH